LTNRRLRLNAVVMALVTSSLVACSSPTAKTEAPIGPLKVANVVQRFSVSDLPQRSSGDSLCLLPNDRIAYLARTSGATQVVVRLLQAGVSRVARRFLALG
jgi:hypothetical protein